EVLLEPEDRRAALGLVRPDPLEDARPVVQTVRADMNGGVRPVHELAVHPDLAGLAHSGSPLISVGPTQIVPPRPVVKLARRSPRPRPAPAARGRAARSRPCAATI